MEEEPYCLVCGMCRQQRSEFLEPRGMPTAAARSRCPLSVSLDGRREKFVPGLCVNCHGGDNYGGKFPDDYGPTSPPNWTGSGQANLGSFFLPFDVANFHYSTSDAARSRQTLLKPLRQMNELLASFTPSDPSDPTRPVTNDVTALITTRWYPPANTNDEQTFPTPSNYELFGTTNALGQPTVGQQFPGNGVTSCIDCHDAQNASPFGPHDSTEKWITVIAPSCRFVMPPTPESLTSRLVC